MFLLSIRLLLFEELTLKSLGPPELLTFLISEFLLAY